MPNTDERIARIENLRHRAKLMREAAKARGPNWIGYGYAMMTAKRKDDEATALENERLGLVDGGS